MCFRILTDVHSDYMHVYCVCIITSHISLENDVEEAVENMDATEQRREENVVPEEDGFTEEENKLWSVVQETPTDFNTWTQLLQLVEQRVRLGNRYYSVVIKICMLHCRIFMTFHYICLHFNDLMNFNHSFFGCFETFDSANYPGTSGFHFENLSRWGET